MLEWSEYVKILIAVIVIMNPPGAIPFFISMTDNMSKAERRAIPTVTAISIAIVLAVAALIGELILRFFGISIASFKVAGGILLMLMALAMMQAKQSRSRQTPEEAMEAEEKDSIAVVPLAIPLLAGPGSISTVIIYSHGSSHPGHLVVLVLIGCIAAALCWGALHAAEPISRLIGRTGINIAMRVMGILLAAIAVEFITGGVMELWPGLGAR